MKLEKVAHELVCIAEFYAKEGKEDTLIQLLYGWMAVAHKEAGCVRYELNQSIDNPLRLVFVEKWANQELFDKHCSMPYITEFFENTQSKY